MANPADRHFDLVDQERALERLRQAVNILERSEVPFTVEGGWAVAAYDSPAPSVDLDVLVDGDLEPGIAERIEAATGIQIHSISARDQLGIDIADSRKRNYLLGTEFYYVPHDFLQGHIVRRPVKLLDGLVLPVPHAAQLAMMKLKAFHDRRLQWEALRERYRLAALPQDVRERTLLLGPAYWERKAGKDLFDLAVLLDGHTTLREVEEATPRALWAPLRMALDNPPLPLRQFAEGMAERAGSAWSLPRL